MNNKELAKRKEQLKREEAHTTLTSTPFKDLVEGNTRGAFNADTAILLDVSGSMAEQINACTKEDHTQWMAAIDALKMAVEDLPMDNAFTFSSVTERIHSHAEIGKPRGGTHMAPAIRLAAEEGFDHLIIVGDGKPWDKDETLHVARETGVTCDIIYIGAEPMPQFFKDLAEATGGSSSIQDPRFVLELESKISGLLGPGSVSKGPIEL